MGKVVQAVVSAERISPLVYQDLVSDKSAGATVLFTGDVRDNDQDKAVLSLEYEAHPTSQEILQKVADEISEKFDVLKVALAHRVGLIPIGETAFIVCVSAKHRQAAFAACSELVDEVKKQIPIWKHQIFADGTDQWVNFA